MTRTGSRRLARARPQLMLAVRSLGRRPRARARTRARAARCRALAARRAVTRGAMPEHASAQMARRHAVARRQRPRAPARRHQVLARRTCASSSCARERTASSSPSTIRSCSSTITHVLAAGAGALARRASCRRRSRSSTRCPRDTALARLVFDRAPPAVVLRVRRSGGRRHATGHASYRGDDAHHCSRWTAPEDAVVVRALRAAHFRAALRRLLRRRPAATRSRSAAS